MRTYRPTSFCLALGSLLALSFASASAVTVGQLDAFSTNAAGWRQGFRTGVVVNSGGPAGAGDGYLLLDTTTALPAKLVVFNDAQWKGNYITAGVTSLSLDVKNFGPDAVNLRVALGDVEAPNIGGTWFVSSTPVPLAAGEWASVSLSLAEADLTRTQGTDTYAQLLGDVQALRLLNAEGVSPFGDFSTGMLGIDNILAVGAAAATPGDFDHSGAVDGLDLAQWGRDFAEDSGSDVDDDGDSDGADFLIWQSNFGAGAAAAAANVAVPEPPAACLAILAAAWCRRKRSRVC